MYVLKSAFWAFTPFFFALAWAAVRAFTMGAYAPTVFDYFVCWGGAIAWYAGTLFLPPKIKNKLFGL